MAYQKIQKSASWTPNIQKKTPSLAPPPIVVQRDPGSGDTEVPMPEYKPLPPDYKVEDHPLLRQFNRSEPIQLQAKTSPTPVSVEPLIIQMRKVYRGGSRSDDNLTPRPGKDDDEKKSGRGLSTNTSPPQGKSQIIETDNLSNDLEAVNDHSTHYAIRPTNDGNAEKLKQWASTRGSGQTHQYTTDVRNACYGQRDRSGNETNDE